MAVDVLPSVVDAFSVGIPTVRALADQRRNDSFRTYRLEQHR